MVNNKDEYFSKKLTRFFMKFVGIWIFETWREQLILNLCLLYTTAAVIFAIAVEAVDLYFCWGNFDAVIYNACTSMALVLVLVKVSVFVIRRDVVAQIIRYSEKNFWKVDYNDFGQQVMRECDKKGFTFIVTYFMFVFSTVFNYIVAPIVENIDRNATDRALPFKLWIDLPVSTTPYFETIFIIQSLSTIHSGMCFFCFDNMLFMFTIQTVGQLKILQQRLRIICDDYLRTKYDPNNEKESTVNNTVHSEIYDEFKSCIDQHRTLIDFIDTLESVFNIILLCQMLVSSVLMCLGGFQILMATLNNVRRFIFISFVLGCFTQLVLLTWTCNEITFESTMIGDAAYDSRWYGIPHDKIGTSLKMGMLILMARVRHPLYLTAGKFCPMSLNTFIAIMRTAGSYFTLLNQMNEEIEH